MRPFKLEHLEPYQTHLLTPLSACVLRPLRVNYHAMGRGHDIPHSRVPWHTLACVTRGEASYSFGDNVQIKQPGGGITRAVFGPGMLLWIPQNVTRRMVVTADECVMYSFQFGLVGEFAPSSYGLPEDMLSSPYLVRLHDDGYCLSLFQRLYYLWIRRRQFDLLEIQGVGLQILAQLAQEGVKPASPRIKRQVQNVLDYMDDHYYDPDLSLPDLASVVGWSPKYLISVFRDVVGQSPMSYLQNLRIRRSLDLLETGRYSVCQVAELVGYRDPSYFGRVFRRFVGISPSQYVKSLPLGF
ncbi:MAG: helix-turn-helix transcriptional regulator [Bacteroidota bacterium]